MIAEKKINQVVKRIGMMDKTWLNCSRFSDGNAMAFI